MIEVLENIMPDKCRIDFLHFFYTFYREKAKIVENSRESDRGDFIISALQKAFAKTSENELEGGIGLLISGSGVRVPGGVPSKIPARE